VWVETKVSSRQMLLESKMIWSCVTDSLAGRKQRQWESKSMIKSNEGMASFLPVQWNREAYRTGAVFKHPN